MKKSILLNRLKLGVSISFLLIFALIFFKGGWIKNAKASNSMTCSTAPYIVKPGENITISAVVNFTASDVWGVIENEDGIVQSHYSLTSGDGQHYSRTYAPLSAASGRYDVGLFATVQGTGQQVFCNPSVGDAWIKKSLNDAKWTGRLRHKTVVFQNKIWIIGGYDYDYESDVWSSSDGANWQLVTADAPWGTRRMDFGAVVFNNKIWVFGGAKYNSLWTTYTLQNDVWSSIDGYHWTQETSSAAWSARSFFGYAVYDNKIWIAGGCTSVSGTTCIGGANDVWYSSDGVNWTRETASADWTARMQPQLIVHNDGSGDQMFLIGGITFGPQTYQRDVYASADGNTWTQKTSLIDSTFEARYGYEAISYNFGSGQKIWLMGGSEANNTHHNDIWSSSDGITWTQNKDDTALPGIAVQPSKWTMWSPRRHFQIIAFNNGSGTKVWLLGGYDRIKQENDIWYTSNGTDWTLANNYYETEYGNRFDTAVAVYNNKLWLVAGVVKQKGIAHDVWSSTDGINWTCEFGSYTSGIEGVSCNHLAPAWSARWDEKLMVYDDGSGEKMYMVGGCTYPGPTYGSCPNGYGLNDVWAYDDSSHTWTQKTANAAFNARFEPAYAVYNNKMWLMGGLQSSNNTLLNDAWYSTDGATWTQTNNANWSIRLAHSALVYDNKLWVMGGQTSGGVRLNDVWYTTDPTSGWTEVTSAAAWAGRLTFGLLNFNNRMWVISGQKNGATIAEILGSKDIWWSTDGANWTETTDTADFAGRDFFSAAVFQDRIWLTGGDSNQGAMDDVWASRYGDMTYYVMQPDSGMVNIYATVDPTLSLTLSGNTCSLGTLRTDALRTCGYTATVQTNAVNGYTGFISQNQGFKSGSYQITDESDDFKINGTGTLSAQYGEYGIGVQTTDTASYLPTYTGDCSSNYDSLTNDLDAKGLSDTNQHVFASYAGPVDGATHGVSTLCHGVRIKYDTPPGIYSHIVTITAVGNF